MEVPADSGFSRKNFETNLILTLKSIEPYDLYNIDCYSCSRVYRDSHCGLYHCHITNVIQQRRMGQVTTAQQANEQQDAISSVMGRLIAIGEAYPELKADGLFRETMDGVRAYEEKVRMSRMVYNDTATKYNRLIRQFPSSIVASMLNYNTQKDYLQVDDQKKTNYPDLDDVFKK